MSEYIIQAKEYEEDSILEELVQCHYLETYDDYAGLLKKMGKAVDEMLALPTDDVERNNLKILSKLLPICSDLFIDCDPYYRR